jgi:ATP synthase protein I
MKLDKNVIRNLALITQVGISMLAPVVLCVFFGLWLDEKFHWNTVLVLLILGILAGARNTWILLQDIIDRSGGKKK